MDFTDILVHLLNFLAPAFWLSVFLVLAGRLLSKGPRRMAWWAQGIILFLVGTLALLLALWLSGRDGRMLGYAALVLSCGSTHWLLLRRSGR